MIKPYLPYLFIIILSIIIISSCNKEDLNHNCDGRDPSYSSDILPIVNRSCALSGCHVKGFKNGDYTTYSGLKAKADNGKLGKRIVKKQNMPPKSSSAQKLTAAEMELFNCWIQRGAKNN